MNLMQDLASQLGIKPPATPPIPNPPHLFFPALEFEVPASSVYGRIYSYGSRDSLNIQVHSECCGKRLFDVNHRPSALSGLGRPDYGDIIEIARKCPRSNCGAIERNYLEIGTGRVANGAVQGVWRDRRKHFLGNANVLKGRIDVPCSGCKAIVRVEPAEVIRAAVLAAEQVVYEAEGSPEQDA